MNLKESRSPGVALACPPDLMLAVCAADAELALADPSDVFGFCQALHEAARGLLPLDAFYVALFDDATHTLTFPYLADGDDVLPSSVAPIGRGPTSWVVRHRQALVLSPEHEAIHRDAIRFGGDLPSASALHVPMRVSENGSGFRVAGVISAQTYAPEAYTVHSLHVLMWLADRAAQRLFGRPPAPSPEEPDHRGDLEMARRVLDALRTAETEIEAALAAADEHEGPGALDRIRAVFRRITARAVSQFTERHGAAPHLSQERLAALTVRELDVLALLAEGCSNHDIATRLFISDDTVKSHVAGIFRKLKVRSRLEAAMAMGQPNGDTPHSGERKSHLMGD